MSLLLKNAQLISGEEVNIFIKDELIYELTTRRPVADQIIEAAGKLIMPGIIDPHVHFRVPGAEHKEDWDSGSRAAAAGGITTVLDMPNNQPSVTSLKLLERKRQFIRGRSYVNYGLYLGATEDNLEELKAATGIAGIKVYLGSTTGDLLVRNYQLVEKILENCEHLIVFHSEDENCLQQQILNSRFVIPKFSSVADFHAQLRPEKCAVRSTQKIIELVKKTKKPAYICHVSTARELALIKRAKTQQVSIFIEATPHHLFLDIEQVKECGNFAKVNPPLRSAESQKALQQALADRLFDTIGTDHAPHLPWEKGQAYQQAPAGLPGVETVLPLMLDHYHHHRQSISLELIQELMCAKPARLFNIKKRGQLQPGFYADLVLLDLNLTKQVENSKLYTKCGWSSFAGCKLTGWPVVTIVNGQIVFREGQIIGRSPGREVI